MPRLAGVGGGTLILAAARRLSSLGSRGHPRPAASCPCVCALLRICCMDAGQKLASDGMGAPGRRRMRPQDVPASEHSPVLTQPTTGWGAPPCRRQDESGLGRPAKGLLSEANRAEHGRPPVDLQPL